MVPTKVKEQLQAKVLETLTAYFNEAEEMEDAVLQDKETVQNRFRDFVLYLHETTQLRDQEYYKLVKDHNGK